MQLRKYIKDIVYGANDGMITTFAVVAGVVGASLSSTVILILGFANLIADGFSMSIGDYLSTKSEKEYYKTERDREAWEVKHYPEGEKAEMMEFYIKKGLSKEEAKKIVQTMSKNDKIWIDTMMLEELNLV